MRPQHTSRRMTDGWNNSVNTNQTTRTTVSRSFAPQSRSTAVLPRSGVSRQSRIAQPQAAQAPITGLIRSNNFQESRTDVFRNGSDISAEIARLKSLKSRLETMLRFHGLQSNQNSVNKNNLQSVAGAAINLPKADRNNFNKSPSSDSLARSRRRLTQVVNISVIRDAETNLCDVCFEKQKNVVSYHLLNY